MPGHALHRSALRARRRSPPRPCWTNSEYRPRPLSAAFRHWRGKSAVFGSQPRRSASGCPAARLRHAPLPHVPAWPRKTLPALAENPGSASALALCWVHVFILPPLLARPWRGLLRLILTASIGVAAAAIALAAGFVAGLQVGSMALRIGFAFSGPYTGAYHEPPGPLLQTVQDVIGDIMLWSGPAAGSAISLIAPWGLPPSNLVCIDRACRGGWSYQAPGPRSCSCRTG